jgi:hypothetical protein
MLGSLAVLLAALATTGVSTGQLSGIVAFAVGLIAGAALYAIIGPRDPERRRNGAR